MKQVLIIFFLYSYLFSPGQEPDSNYTTSHFEYRFPKIKSKIFLIKGNTLRASVTKITDSVVIYVASGNADDQSGFDSIPVSDIKKMKIKRHAVENGMIGGGGIGFILGYGAGYITYNVDDYASGTDNDESRKLRAELGGFIGAVPGVVVGGMIGGVFAKRVFTINGKPENMLKLVNFYDRKQPFN